MSGPGLDLFGEQIKSKAEQTLAGRFGVPPFTVLDARQGYWQERKRAWIALGIRSELGRGDDLIASGESSVYSGKSAWAKNRGGKRASPGGSPRPAMRKNGEGKIVRGDGYGRALAAQGALFEETEEETEAAPAEKQRRAGDGNKLGFSPSVTIKRHGVGFDGSALLRGEMEATDAPAASGTSIFDPVLCELAYRWFCPTNGRVLDPFAGGSVRGIVAAKLGRRYTGIDLSAPQVAANREQAYLILGPPPARQLETYGPDDLTPVEGHGGVLVKRDDLCEIAGVRGGKVRTCWALAQGAPGLVTAGSRASPQANIVAAIAARLGIPCHVHTPTGELSPELKAAQGAGALVFQHKAGYNNVIIARAREDAAAYGYREIPFGMQCQEAVEQTRQQVANIPDDAERIVVPIGSGMSLAGILWGLKDRGLRIHVVGVVVGAIPDKRLDEYAPPGWADMVTLVASGSDYHEPASDTRLDGLELDPYYEAKCLPFLATGDLLWIVGIRQTALATQLEIPSEAKEGDFMVAVLPSASASRPAPPPGWTALPAYPEPRWIQGDSRAMLEQVEEGYDFIFSCPPYGDLEVYSDDPADLSNHSYEAFIEGYRDVIAKAAAKLAPNRFAAFVVGNYRADSGLYRDFVGETVRAFEAAGMALYNEAVLVTMAGSLPLRVGKQFSAGRKLGRSHQNVLLFVKGDWRKAADACGSCEFGDFRMLGE